MVVGIRSYNLRMRRQQEERLSPPPSSPDSSSPPPPSRRRRSQRQRSKKLTVYKPRRQLYNAVPSPTPPSVSVDEVLQLPPPPPAAGYSEEIPVDIPSEEEDQKPNIDDPLSGLKPPPPSVRQNASTMFVEKSLGIIASVKSLLVDELLSLPNSEIITMISSANRVFTALDCFGNDYISFYWTVRRFIHFNQEFVVAERLRNGHCAVFEEVTRRYEELVIEANSAEEALHSAELNLVKAKEDVACLRQRLDEARSLVFRLEMELDHEENEVVAWDSEVIKCSWFHSSAEAEVQRVGSEEEEVKKVVDEVNKRCKEASSGIELMTKELSLFRIS
ncbi:hypothetical protein RHGRI_005835 [Rhododendron griersonianum]|uniref:Uncharacterized protein n=1 Tax=Rhododendron griersonianum TaxID=479676 RepID=A0AAV6LEQ8_9ERIC|nr:hypothetical protein RHGRI_005835 [Rhododendron griersonianum]